MAIFQGLIITIGFKCRPTRISFILALSASSMWPSAEINSAHSADELSAMMRESATSVSGKSPRALSSWAAASSLAPRLARQALLHLGILCESIHQRWNYPCYLQFDYWIVIFIDFLSFDGSAFATIKVLFYTQNVTICDNVPSIDSGHQ